MTGMLAMCCGGFFEAAGPGKGRVEGTPGTNPFPGGEKNGLNDRDRDNHYTHRYIHIYIYICCIARLLWSREAMGSTLMCPFVVWLSCWGLTFVT